MEPDLPVWSSVEHSEAIVKIMAGFIHCSYFYFIPLCDLKYVFRLLHVLCCLFLCGDFYPPGYNVVVRIPAGATNIDVKQVSYSGKPEDDNYLGECAL